MRYLTHGTIRPRRETERNLRQRQGFPRIPLEGFRPVLSRKNPMRYKDHAYNKSAKGRPKNRAESVVCGSRWNYYLRTGRATPFIRAHKPLAMLMVRHSKQEMEISGKEEPRATRQMVFRPDELHSQPFIHLTFTPPSPAPVPGHRSESNGHHVTRKRGPKVAEAAAREEARHARAASAPESSFVAHAAPVIPINRHEGFRRLRLVRHREESAPLIELRPAHHRVHQAGADCCPPARPRLSVAANGEKKTQERASHHGEAPFLDFNRQVPPPHEGWLGVLSDILGARGRSGKPRITPANDVRAGSPPAATGAAPKAEPRPPVCKPPASTGRAETPAAPPHEEPRNHREKGPGYISSPQKKTLQLKVARADASPPQ